MERTTHWNTVYTTKAEDAVSWFEALPEVSLRMLDAAGMTTGTCVPDVTDDWSLQPMDVWHDRAVFHFLVNPDEHARYGTHLRQTLKIGGTAIITTFAPDGPEKCSGLPVARYSPDTLAEELGPAPVAGGKRAARAHAVGHAAVVPVQPLSTRRLTVRRCAQTCGRRAEGA